VQKLLGAGASGAAGFGHSVALSSTGATVLVGGRQDDESAGAAWIFTQSGSAWNQHGAKLAGDGEVEAAAFGTSVSLSKSGAYALIGGPNNYYCVGDGWIFNKAHEGWAQQATVQRQASDAL
jgi:FG-GAP repeat